MKLLFFIGILCLIGIVGASVDDSYTTSLLHYDTVGGSTDFIDENPINIWYPRNALTINGENLPTWINNSEFDGISQYVETQENTGISFNLSSLNWTWDSRILFSENDVDYTHGIWTMGHYDAGVSRSAILTIRKGSYDLPYIYLTVYKGPVIYGQWRYQIQPYEYDENNWHHIQISRCGNISITTDNVTENYISMLLFIDGIKRPFSYIATPIGSTSFGNMLNMTLGRNDASFLPNVWFWGKLDETRFSCGICRNTSNFTVPSGPYEPIPTPTPTPVPTTEPFPYAPQISVQQPSAMGIPQAWYPWLILIGFAPIWILLLYSIRKV
jgi:hypothetical protein